MGTRGFVGFIADGQEKITYNHFDSYPDGVGMDVLNWLRTLNESNIEDVRALARELTVVTEETPFTDDHILRLARWTNTHVGNQGIHNEAVHDWYQLLRNTQGSPSAMLEAGFVLDAHKFPLDSLFCEWGYLIDFDNDVFEVYRGFQKQPPTAGRWAGITETADFTGSYYPVQQVASYSLPNGLPSDEQFLKDCDEDDENE